MVDETAQSGWDALARMLDMPLRTLMTRRSELSAAGVIFYRLEGRGGKKHKCMKFFPSVVKSYLVMKSSQGHNI